MSGHHECSGDKCGYRRLYEGSQVSLSDMAARQGAALGRVGRLRGAISTTLRRNFPEMSSRAEQQLGARLSDIDDEILIAYLEAFVSNAVASNHQAPTEALRNALRARGIIVSGDDIALWIAQLGAATSPTFDAEEKEVADGSRTGQQRPALLRVTNTTDLNASRVPTVPESHAEGRKESSSGSELTTATTASAAPSLASIFADAAGVTLWAGPLGEKNETSTNWNPSPVAPGLTGDSAQAPLSQDNRGQQAAAEPAKRKKGRNPRKGPKEPDKAGPKREQVDTPSQKQHPAAASPAAGTFAESAGTSAQGKDDGKNDPVAAGPPALPDEKLGNVEPLQPGAPAEAAKAGTAILPRQTQPAASVKPELVNQPAEKRKRQPKQLRLQAEPAKEDPPAKGKETLTSELDTGTKEALIAAASIPRPVFVRDLVGITGDPALVEAWERECRGDPANNPVRFISPKVRHRNRGSLVFGESSKAASASPDTWWGKCISIYRGARLYELAVLLHRVGDQLVSHWFDSEAALLRLNTDKGLNGVVVVFDTQLAPGESTRDALAQALSDLLEERLVLITILTTSAEPGSLETLITTVEELARERSFKPVAPIVAARSWEYADDRGSTSLLVIGASN